VQSAEPAGERAIKENSIRRAVREGRAALGTGLKEFASRGVPWIIEAAGFDYCAIDHEHGAFDMETIANLGSWFQATNVSAIVPVLLQISPRDRTRMNLAISGGIRHSCISVPDMDVAMANPGRLNAQQHLFGLRIWVLPRFQRLSPFDDLHRAHDRILRLEPFLPPVHAFEEGQIESLSH
jgi:hypothetical protein